jgi:hypothetical protein
VARHPRAECVGAVARHRRNPTKPGFEIDFDHYTTGQQFLGLRAIILDNLSQDPAMIREKVAMAFFNRMREAAPRDSFARLYINGLLGYAGMNNFSLYQATARGQQRVLVWDLDLSFRDYDSSIFLRADENELFRRAMAYPDLHTLYLQKLEDCARSALEDDWLSNEIVSSAALIRGSAVEDRVKPFSNDGFDSAVSWMKDFGRLRSAYVLEAVADARRQ